MTQLSDLQHIKAKLTDIELRKSVRKLTPTERRQQMISWIMGTLSPDSTTTVRT